jgi:hypothetical protein
MRLFPAFFASKLQSVFQRMTLLFAPLIAPGKPAIIDLQPSSVVALTYQLCDFFPASEVAAMTALADRLTGAAEAPLPKYSCQEGVVL